MVNNFFKGIVTVEEIKAKYKELARIHHPDLGGDLETMKALNNAYEAALKAANGQTSVGADGKKHTYAYDEATEAELMEIIAALLSLNLDGVDITLIGTWVWITGDTRPHKDKIKEVGCRWNAPRACWYYRPTTQKWRRGRSSGSLEDLASSYGATDCSKFKKSAPTRRRA